MSLDTARRSVQYDHPRVDGSVDDFCGHCDSAWPCPSMQVLESEARLRELLAEWLEVTSHYAPPKGPLADETRAALGESND